MIRLLIADDEKLERDALTEMVARRFDEHQVVLETAENGRKAADTAILWGADLILMDIEMPGMSGLDAAGPCWPSGRAARVIFVTAYSLFQYAHEAVHLGACDYLLKPVDPDELEASIRRLSARSRPSASWKRWPRCSPSRNPPQLQKASRRQTPRKAARMPWSWTMCGGIWRTTTCSTSRWTAWARFCTSARHTCRHSSKSTRR